MTWTWKQLVADQILDLVNAKGSPTFTLDELAEREAIFRAQFPGNQHVREKLRQKLQQLRDFGFLNFQGSGVYCLNLDYDDLELSSAPPSIESPIAFTNVTRQIRLRDSLLATNLKRRYRHFCQICNRTISLGTRNYAECHHLQPLGRPHLGPDIEANLLVVCPNDHVMLDRGALLIDPDTLVVNHVVDAIERRPLTLQPWHRIERRYLEYHTRQICGRA